MQGFDIYGRLNQVAVDGIGGEFTYGYLEGSHLQKTLDMPNGVTRTFGYEASRDLLTMIVHSNATERLVQRDFTFDGLGRLIDRTLVRASGSSSSAPDAFGYNIRSELTNAIINANAFAYNFDPIGNRNSATEFGTNTAYVTSALNQYTSINPINPVNPVENTFNPVFDLDGNQTLLKTTTGIWHVTYNAENRPILFSNDTTRVDMAYDCMGRRFEYKETVAGTLTLHERYLYRGYLQIAALDMLNGANVKHTIVWDASERVATRPLALQIGTAAYYYSFDQVKNVTELFDSTGALASTYDYTPFGQITSLQITQSGNNAITQFSNPLTFSSEIHDSTLGLQYYNYRHLNTLDGRWVNRDPIGEQAFRQLYSRSRTGIEIYEANVRRWTPLYEYCINSPTKNIDLFGLTNDPNDFGGGVTKHMGFDYYPRVPTWEDEITKRFCPVFKPLKKVCRLMYDFTPRDENLEWYYFKNLHEPADRRYVNNINEMFDDIGKVRNEDPSVHVLIDHIEITAHEVSERGSLVLGDGNGYFSIEHKQYENQQSVCGADYRRMRDNFGKLGEMICPGGELVLVVCNGCTGSQGEKLHDEIKKLVGPDVKVTMWRSFCTYGFGIPYSSSIYPPSVTK